MIQRITASSATVRLVRSALLPAVDGSQSRFRFSTITRATEVLPSSTIATTRPNNRHGSFIRYNRISFCSRSGYSTASLGIVDAAQSNKQQIVESEHLMKALLEPKDGLATQILTEAGLNNASVLQVTDNFIAQHTKVSDDSDHWLGSSLSSLLENARKFKKQMEDDLISVEHILLALSSDTRFGKQLFRDLNLSEESLKDAVQAVCGSQKVTDQYTEWIYEALEEYGDDLDLIELTRDVIENVFVVGNDDGKDASHGEKELEDTCEDTKCEEEFEDTYEDTKCEEEFEDTYEDTKSKKEFEDTYEDIESEEEHKGTNEDTESKDDTGFFF